MSYIIFVQPAVLSGELFGQPTGMDFGAITTATCLAAALVSAIMGLYARRPFAQAPGMGENFFFVFSAIPAAAAAGSAVPWATALGAVFISGVLFLLLSLVGVAQQAGLMRDGRLPRARQAFVSDAVGTVAGACLGTSTVTSYVESATGVEQGGRTGLTAVTVAGLLLLALFFSPVIEMLGGYAPVTAPALVLVGAMMLRNVAQAIRW